jgi:hypothetical protein
MNISALRQIVSSLQFRLILLAACLLLTRDIALGQAVPDNWTDDMPSLAKVEQQIQGTGPTDTLERQVAVFEYLQMARGIENTAVSDTVPCSISVVRYTSLGED